jgi:putative FmdB family regulatory protein
MPVYEYQCEDCGRKFDILATLAEKEAGLNPVCPRCGRTRVRQVLGRFTLLTGSKSESDEFDAGLDDDGLGAGMDDAGLDDLDAGDGGEFGGEELDDID